MKQLAMPNVDDRVLWDTWMAGFQFQALAVADDLGVFTLLQRRPVSAECVAVQLSLPTRRVEQLLAVLAGLDLLTEAGGFFALTDTARAYLLPGSPFYWGPALAYFREISVSFGTLRSAIQGPRPPSEHPSAGMEAAAGFTRAMHCLSLPAATSVALCAELGDVRSLLDVGGGSGSYCISLAMRYPRKRFTVGDLAEVVCTTREYLAAYGVQEQVDVLAFDMFDTPWPSSFDAHFCSNIFHGFDANTCTRLARSSFEALPPGGRILVHEVLLSAAKDGRLTPASFALAMTYFNGRGGQYTGAELASFLRDAGFVDIKTIPTYGYYSLISGVKG